MAKVVKCPLCGSTDNYAYRNYAGDGRNGKTEYHCNECELDFFEGDKYENKFHREGGVLFIETVQVK